MRLRVALTVVYAVVLGVLTYADQKSVDVLPGGEDSAAVAFLTLTVIVGAAVGRWWVLAALIGGFLPLVYLQATGYLGHGFDGADPISPSSIAGLIWCGLFLLLGVGLRWLWERFRAR